MAAIRWPGGWLACHAVDADHIAAIDNVTRKMMQQGGGLRRGVAFAGPIIDCGVIRRRLPRPPPPLLTQMSWLHDTGSVIGTAVSALLYSAMAFITCGFT